ncbi:hypothetical protein BBF96_15340 [Anoxybacter fermentans]|uniref:Small, acid-soluble spore protein H n=1 Tax=Anoxybacter fermentans TaxID=1323375 RepID=A0A3S9T264_9FIRM|nr:H-type small acid-soluble spore protein [Anoxybacter fermentans]AZR74627.1 hypothetical protein BBF96_15340 [Anoxybacter fermentans]
MKFERAQEILNSPETIDVTYKGTKVWITNLNASKNTAQVKMPATSNNIIEVPVDQLVEEG